MNATPTPPASPTDLAAMVTRASRRAVAAALGMVLLLLGLLLTERGLFLHLEDGAHDRVAQASEVAHRLQLLDEQLTMAAQLVAQSNDAAWRARYNLWLPQYVEALAQATELASPALAERLHAGTKKSCDALEALEAEVFKLADQGRLEQAQTILAGADYRRHRQVLAEGNGEFLRDMRAEVRHSSDLITQRAWTVLACTFTAVLVALAWLWRNLNRQLVVASAGFARQHQAQLDLQWADRGKAQILDGARAGTWIWSTTDDVLSFNAQAAAMVGLPQGAPALASNAAWNALLHAGDVERSGRDLVQHLKGQTPHYEAELRVRHGAGHWVWLQVRGQVAQRDARGRALTVAGTLTDMTARVQAEQLWQARAELSSDWYWQTDTAHRLSQVHTGLDARLAALAQAMIGRRRDEIAEFEPPAEGWAALHRRMDAREPFKGVAYVSHAWAGVVRWIELDGRPRLDADGRFLGYEGVGRDITERRRVADELRASLALVDALFQAIPVPVVVKDMQGATLRLNRAYAEHYRQPPQALLGLRSDALLDPEAAAAADADRAEMARTGEPMRRVSRARLQDGRVRDAIVHKAPLFDAQGRMNGMVAVVIDVTDEKDAARALEQARDAAEAANRTKSVFLATMSHEIRTPMNGVLGMGELLSRTALDPRQAQTVRTIMESAGALLRIIDDILDFSKMEAGRLALEPAPLDLRALIQSVVDTLSPAAVRQGLALRVTVDADVPAWVRGDSTRLRQVLTNLLGNAVKFGRGVARDDLARPGPVSVDLRRRGERLCLSVTDHGIGMDAPTRERLFQPFMQAEPATARRFGGTGLGLAITRRLVSLMDGQIDVDSTPGRGSTFTVLLPLAAADAPAATGPGPVAASAGPAAADGNEAAVAAAAAAAPLILVAEDDEVNRMVVMRQLEILGYAAEVAEDGPTALALWRSGRFGLLVTDLNMPGMDGYELVRTIRREAPVGTPRRPILALTANAMKGEAQRALEAGMDAYLTKPIRLQDLQDALQRSLAGAAPFVPSAPSAPSAPFTPSSPLVDVAAPPSAAGSALSMPAGLPVFDRDHLPDLLGGNAAAMSALLLEFERSTPESLRALVAALRSADWPGVRDRAHSLKSAAQTVGALELAACCVKAESAAAGGGLHPHEAAALADRISAGWPALQQALHESARVKEPASP